MNQVTGQTDDQSWTIERVLSWATDDFRRRGIETARLDAEVLLGDLLELDRVHLITEARRPLGAGELGAYRKRIVRRRRHEPVAYIIGHREFFGLDFVVDERVLIPRADTEILVEVALERTSARSLFGRALDLCTGSGCVAIAFARQRPTWHVTGTDLSTMAIDVARHNAQRLGAVLGVNFQRSDLFANVAGEPKFDLITANPPYISDSEMTTLPPSVRDFEPDQALRGGPEGLTVVGRILGGAMAYLAPGGVLAVEIGAGQARDVAQRFEQAGFEEVKTQADYAGILRVVSGVRG